MDSKISRRRFMSLLTTGVATPYIITLSGCGGGSSGGGEASRTLDETSGTNADVENGSVESGVGNNFKLDSERVFSLSIASGDPTASGVILWTRIDPSAYLADAFLTIQIAEDAEFKTLVLESIVEPSEIGAFRDYTVNIDLDGQLQSSRRYFYRFIYDNTVSKTGRCRTAPPEGIDTDRLKLAVITCQDYTNGYYGALNYLAEDDSIDFVIHLGDFIYETAGDPKFQSLPFADRLIIMPSDGIVAMDLEDYRHLYKTYRSDPFLQKAMENHTWIMTRDDHETSNDAYWDYARDTLGAPDHPYTLEGNDPAKLMQLMLDSQQAWVEYVPARVKVKEGATHPHEFLQYYREVKLGNLVDLFMLDGRTYRSAHSCGEGLVGGRYFPLFCGEWKDKEHTMLGDEQKEWLVNGLSDSNARWKLLGNQTFMAPLWIGNKSAKVPLNTDAWDGFDYERNWLNQEIKSNQIENLVVLTGDLHTYMASHVKLDYYDTSDANTDNYIGVEFMTPSVTSAGLLDMVAGLLGGTSGHRPADDTSMLRTPNDYQARYASRLAQQRSIPDNIFQLLTSELVYNQNPHVDYFNTIENGYSTVEFTQDQCDWKAYRIDKGVNEGNHGITLLRHFRKRVDSHLLERVEVVDT